MRNIQALFAVTLLFISCLFTAVASADDWTLLGSRVVTDRTEVDEIHVGANEGAFSRLRFDVGNAPVEFKRIVITFGNGTSQTVERDFLVGKRGKGVVFDLKGGQRKIKNVKLVYEAHSPGFKKATVQLFGK
jgi:hypothetical protein